MNIWNAFNAAKCRFNKIQKNKKICKHLFKSIKTFKFRKMNYYVNEKESSNSSVSNNCESSRILFR